MMYRAKITHCAAIIANIYGSDYPYIAKDFYDTWIEVKSQEEVDLINDIEHEQECTFIEVKNLEKIAKK